MRLGLHRQGLCYQGPLAAALPTCLPVLRGLGNPAQTLGFWTKELIIRNFLVYKNKKNKKKCFSHEQYWKIASVLLVPKLNCFSKRRDTTQNLSISMVKARNEVGSSRGRS